jgi:hypothetical protein
VFETARDTDDDALRALLRDSPLPGWVSLSFEREPSYFPSVTVEGDVHETMIARETSTGRIVGAFGRAEFDAFVNGREQRVGYLSQLRVDPTYRGRVRRLRQGFEACRKLLHKNGRAPFYLTSILAANRRARRLLLAGLPGLPTYREITGFSTLVLPTNRVRHKATVARVRRATVDDVPEVAALLQRQYCRYQCAPVWSEALLRSSDRCHGLEAGDFFVAERGKSIVGCASLWDQQSFKQQVVRGYSAAVQRWRRLANLFSPLAGLPSLPSVGTALRLVYLSHLAVEDDEPEIMAALVQAVRTDAKRRGQHLLVLGLSERHPLLAPLKRRFRYLEYNSLLCLVHWEDGAEAAAALDDRPPHVELAML